MTTADSKSPVQGSQEAVGRSLVSVDGLRAISLWQPWASLWCSPAKVHETRHWPTNYRGWLAVHAAKRTIDDFVGSGDRLDEICDGLFGHHWGIDLPRGALVGAVNVVACKRTEDVLQGYYEDDDYECGDFSPARFAWERSNYIVLAEPIPYRGAQGFFNISADAKAAIARATGAA